MNPPIHGDSQSQMNISDGREILGGWGGGLLMWNRMAELNPHNRNGGGGAEICRWESGSMATSGLSAYPRDETQKC